MKKPYTVLLPVDYSVQSEYACRYALHLCTELPAEIHLIHVYKIPYPDPTDPLKYAVDLSKVYNMEMDRLEKYAYELLDKYGYNKDEVRIQLEALEGDIATRIAEYAKINQNDLILLGTHDRHELREYLWGTHTMEIVNKSEIPVMAIPENSVFRSWRKILYATNLRYIEFPVMEYLVKMSRRSEAILEIMHIETEGEDKWETMAEFDKFKEDISKTIDYDKLRINTLYDQKNIADSLMSYCEANGFDMIAVNPARPNISEWVFGRRVTRDLLYKASVPILCVKS